MCRWYEIIYFVHSENSQEILRITFIKIHTQSYHNQTYLSILISLTMTRDSESVETRTARLLRSTVNRRVSLISFDASARSQNVAISWNINMSQQLCQWIINQSDEIIKMLIELRDQQNMTLKLNEQWIDLQVDHIKRLDELEINQTTIDTQEETIVELQEKVLSLKKKQRSANHSRSRQSTESRSTTNHLLQQDTESQASIENYTRQETFKSSFKSFTNDHHRFYKFSNSSIFIDEDESSWEDWRNKMNDKLIVNVDQFDDEIICIIYIMSRLEDDAAKHIFARRCFDSSNSFTSIYELFDHLKEIYDELNKNWKSRREYNALRQADKSFNVFYFDFMKLFSYLDYDDCTLMNDLQNKINNRLQNALSVCSKNFTFLSRLKKFLQDVNNKQRVNYQLRSERCTVIIKVTVVSDKCATLLSMITLIINYVKLTIFFISESARLSIICYICKTSSHLFKNCSQLNKIDTSASWAFTLRLHEIVISKNKKNEKMSSFENSEAKN